MKDKRVSRRRGNPRTKRQIRIDRRYISGWRGVAVLLCVAFAAASGVGGILLGTSVMPLNTAFLLAAVGLVATYAWFTSPRR